MKSIASVLSIIALGFGLLSCTSSGGGGGGGSTSAFAVSTTSANFGVVDIPYNTSTLAATGGTAPFTWATGGGLPAGLSLNASTGAVTGTPVAPAGNFNVTFTVTDSTGQTATGSVLFAIHPKTDLVSIDNGTPPVPGGPGGAVSSSPSISNDGRFVAFASTANNLIPGVGGAQIYLHDWQTNQTTLVSIDNSGNPASGGSTTTSPSISNDGRFVAFMSDATLVTGIVGRQIYLRDVQAGVTSLVSKDNSGIPATGGSTMTSPSIGGNGRFIAYVSDATNLVTGVVGQQIYLYDTQTSGVFPTGQTTLISKDNSPTPLPGDGVSSAPSISQDGCFVAFASLSTSLISPAPGNQQIYVRGPLPGPGNCGASEQTSLISGDNNIPPVPGNGLSSNPTISSNGQFVAFTSTSSTLTGDPDPGPSQIFLRDTQLNTTTLVSQATGVAVAVGDGASSQPTISGDGQFVAFTSLATTLASTLGGSGSQIFLRDTQANTTSLVSQDAVGGSGGNGASSQPTISADGGFAAFSSVSTNFGVAGGNQQIYVRALP